MAGSSAGVLARRMLRPSALVVNAYGFAVRSWRYRRRVAAPAWRLTVPGPAPT